VVQLGAAAERIAGVLADRAIDVSGRTILRWVKKFGPALAEAIHQHWKTPLIIWLVDETYVKILGKWHCLYRGVDLDGHVLDRWLSARGLKSLDCAKLLPTLDAFQLIEHGFVAATRSGLAHAGGWSSVPACRVAGIVNQGSRF